MRGGWFGADRAGRGPERVGSRTRERAGGRGLERRLERGRDVREHGERRRERWSSPKRRAPRRPPPGRSYVFGERADRSSIAKLDRGEISKALPELAEKAAKLARLVPQLSIPLAILGLIDVLIAFLGGLVDQLVALVAEEARIQAAADRAAELGNVQLAGVVDVAKGNVAVQMQSLAGACAPVNQLIALVTVFMQMLGMKGLPNLVDLGPDAAAALQPIKDAVTTLQAIRKTIPV